MALPDKLLPFAREAGAFVRQAFLLPRDGVGLVLPGRVEHDDHVVVFIHGLFATAGVLRPLRERVGRHPGIQTAAFTYRPGLGLEAIAERLGQLLATLPTSVRVHLCGHSLGGLAARYFAVVSHDPRVASTIALATPFGGVRAARVLGRGSALDIGPDSPLLERIRTDARGPSIPHLSIVPGADALSRDPVSHALPGAEVVVIPNIGHNTVLYDRDAIEQVEKRVLTLRNRR